MNMVSETDKRKLLDIYNATDFSANDKIPWVRVGNLYMSLTETGNLSWPPVVLYLHGKGHRNFRILSGRHGSPGGGFGLDSQIGAKVVDPNHYKEDKNVATYLTTGRKEGLVKNDWPSGNLVGKAATLTVEDFGSGSDRDQLKKAAKVYLDKGDTVIFAWCFSFLAMYLYNTEKAELEQKSAQAHLGKSVEQVVKEKYDDWVKRFINLAY